MSTADPTALPTLNREPSTQGERDLRGRVLAGLSVRNIGAVYILAIICVVFSIWVPKTFPTMATVRQVLDTNAVIGMAALALVVPLATRTFDLSFGYTISLSGVTAAHFIAVEHSSVVEAMLLGMLAAVVVGLINAIVVVVIGIDSFIATLATGSLVQAFITYFTNNQTIDDVRLAGGFSKLGQSSTHGFIAPVFYTLAIAVVLWFVMEHTAVGRKLYAAGFNAEAAKLANIRVDRLRFASLIVSSLIAGFAGICLASTLSSGSPTAGTSYLLPGYAAVFVGATQLKSGRFNAWGTIIAVLMLGAGTVGLGLASSAPWAADMFTGVVLIGALAATGFQGRSVRLGRSRPRT